MKSFLLLSSLLGTSLSAAVPRDAAPEPAPQVLATPTRSILEAPTPPWWNWWPAETASPPRITSFPRDAAPEPEPQVLGPPSRTVLEAPTPPWWWHGWPAETPVDSVRRNAAPEPQVLGSVSRTNQVLPTPPAPWWWKPGHGEEVDEKMKREPQTLDLGSTRTVQVGQPTTTCVPEWTIPNLPPPRSSEPYEIDSTITLPVLTLNKKRDPQTLVFSPTRTTLIFPTPPTTHHHRPTTISTNPYEIDATLTLPPLTLDKRVPQSISIVFPITRTNEITPTGPSSTTTKHHHTSVVTVYTTITFDGPTSIHHHHTTIPIPIYTPIPTGTEIDATLTLPFIEPTPIIIDLDKRGKEDPCKNNIFPPPAWCHEPTTVVTVTVTVTATVTPTKTPAPVSTDTSFFATTATLPPLTLTIGSPPWSRKERRSRQQRV